MLAGYSLGDADLLRRAMGKKDPDEMAKQRERFMSRRCRKRSIRRIRRASIFDLMEQFAGLRLQQVALGGLCTARVPHGVAQRSASSRTPGRTRAVVVTGAAGGLFPVRELRRSLDDVTECAVCAGLSDR